MTETAKVAVVTGGGSGLGQACVELFTEKGFRVVAVDLKFDPAVTAGSNPQTETFTADVTSEKDIQTLADHVRQKFGRVDVLVNCAGIACRKPVFDFKTSTPHSLELFTKVLQVNTVGTFNVIRTLLPIMANNEPDTDGQRGVIVNVSSVLGLDGTPGFAAYSASKSAVAGMSLPLAREFAPLGIRVNALAPGFCETPMLLNHPEPVVESFRASLAELAVFPKRMVQPREFAQLVQSIVDNHAINAELIRLDGGIRVSATRQT